MPQKYKIENSLNQILLSTKFTLIKKEHILDGLFNEESDFTIIKSTELTPHPKTLLKKLLMKIFDVNDIDDKTILQSRGGDKFAYISIYKECYSNKGLFDLLEKNVDDDFESIFKTKENHYIIVNQLDNDFLTIRTSGIKVNQYLKGILKVDNSEGTIVETSTLITKGFYYLHNLYNKRNNLTNKDKDESLNIKNYLKGLDVIFPFSLNSKIFYIKSGLKGVAPNIKNAPNLKKLLHNGFIKKIDIGGSKINFSFGNNSLLMKKLFKEYRNYTNEGNLISFLKTLLHEKSNDVDILTKMFFPIEDYQYKYNEIRLEINEGDSSDINGYSFTLKINSEIYEIFNITLGYVKIVNEKKVLILSDSIDLKEKFYEIYKLLNTNNKNIDGINIKKIIYKFIKDNKNTLSYIPYNSEDSNITTNFEKSKQIEYGDFYFLGKINNDDNSIYCIKFKNRDIFSIYKYSSEYQINNVFKKSNNIDSLSEYFDVFLEDSNFLTKIDKNNLNISKNNLNLNINGISNNEDLITKKLSLELNKKVNTENYEYTGKGGNKIEIADMIYSNENSLSLFHFKLAPFLKKHFNGNPGYTNINNVISEMLQKTFFINNNIKVEKVLDYKGKSKILNFIENKEEKEFYVYNNENIYSLFKLDKTRIGRKINIKKPKENDEKRKIIWMQYFYAKNILDSDVTNFTLENGSIKSNLRTIVLTDEDLRKRIFSDKPEKVKDIKGLCLLEFKIGDFIENFS